MLFIEAEPVYYTEQIIENIEYSNTYGEYKFIVEEE